MHAHLCVVSCLSSSLCPLFSTSSTVLLPALPDVYLSAQREVQVQPPVRLPLGDRGHIRLRRHPSTGYEPKKDLNLTNAEELDLATTSDIYWQHTLNDDASFNDPDVDDNQLAKYLAVVVDRTGKPVEMRSNNDHFL